MHTQAGSCGEKVPPVAPYSFFGPERKTELEMSEELPLMAPVNEHTSRQVFRSGFFYQKLSETHQFELLPGERSCKQSETRAMMTLSCVPLLCRQELFSRFLIVRRW